MDIYTNPPPNTYVTGFTKLFTMPTDSGGIPAVAVSRRSASLVVSGYTILTVFIFMVGWNLILSIIMAFWPTNLDPNRYTALIALWNSGESMIAMKAMWGYCRKMMMGGPKTRRASSSGRSRPSDLEARVPTDQKEPNLSQTPQPSEPPASSRSNKKARTGNLWWGICFFLIALTMWAGNNVAGVLIAGELLMGNVAPPAKDSIFYPDVPKYSRNDDNGASIAKLDSLKAPSALRAIGSIEASDVTVRKRVNIVGIPKPSELQETEPWAGRDYDYEVTGVDMGLQNAPKLKLQVKGSCRTDYTWLVNSTNEGDTYKLFGKDRSYTAKLQPDVNLPPMVAVEVDVNSETDKTAFAMIVNTGGLFSYTSGSDAWYFTEPTGSTGMAYQVRRKRPVLNCWETRRWHLNGKDVETDKLETLPGLNLHKVLVDIFKFEFALPRIVSMSRAAGTGALRSATYSVAPSFILDAEASSIVTDLERLVLASWVSSRNVLRDTTTFKGNKMDDIAKGGRGSVEDGVTKFVIQSGDVGTLSVRILISIPVVLLVLVAIDLILSFVLKHDTSEENIILHRYIARGNALLATQLYRGLDEEIYGEDRWDSKNTVIPAVYGNYNKQKTGFLVDDPPLGHSPLPVRDEAHGSSPDGEGGGVTTESKPIPGTNGPVAEEITPSKE
ncbi:hypothetical protein HOY82DRAFT_577051 [Tuber indicum]|nr:hypothetical protein HOY82DRAFT_577051 [Tuber indicum]